MTYWTDEKTDLLIGYAAKGFSAGRIASEMHDTSRNAVIGKAHRMGIKLYGEVRTDVVQRMQAASKRRRNSQRPTPVRVKYFERAIQARDDRAKNTPPAIIEEPTPDNLIPLLDWPSNACKWVYTSKTNQLMFGCTCKPIPGQSYCAGHREKVYVKTDKEPSRRVGTLKPQNFVKLIDRVEA